MKTVRTTILVDADLLDRLERHVHRQRATKTSVIAAALEAWLDAHEATPEFPFLGIGRSSHGRLSLDGRAIARREAGRRPGG
jgi:predicted transcriptional regulator